MVDTTFTVEKQVRQDLLIPAEFIFDYNDKRYFPGGRSGATYSELQSYYSDVTWEGVPTRREMERTKVMKDYQSHWTQRWGAPAGSSEMQKLGHERYVRHQREAEQEELLRDLKDPQRQYTLAAKKIQTALRKNILCACENLTPEQQQDIPAIQLIRLRIKLANGETKCVCYNVVDLFNVAKHRYGSRWDQVKWIDPTYGVDYSKSQVSRIKSAYDQVRDVTRAAYINLEHKLAHSGR